MPRKLKGSVSYYKKKLKAVFSLYIRSRANFQCEASGELKKCGGYIQCAHIKGVGAYPNLQFDPANAVALCYTHHIFWAHKEPFDFTHWFEKKYPERAKYLEEKKNEPFKPTREELVELIKLYKYKTDNL